MNYRARYVLIAIAALVVAILISSVIDPTGKLAVPVALGGVALLLVFIFGYQWRTVGRPHAAEPAPLGKAQRDDPGTIADPDQMLELLALRPVKPEERLDAASSRASMARIAIGVGAVVAVLGLGFTTLLETRVIDPNSLGNGDWTRFLPFILLPFAMLYVRLMMARAATSSNRMLDPLGLTLTQMPKVGIRPRGFQDGMRSDMQGSTVLEGERHGRPVRLELGEVQRTEVRIDVPRFELAGKGERLVPSDSAPAAVRELIQGLGPSSRWKRLQRVQGGPEGIVVERKPDSENGWMWDLWLAERLGAALSG